MVRRIECSALGTVEKVVSRSAQIGDFGELQFDNMSITKYSSEKLGKPLKALTSEQVFEDQQCW